MPQTTDSRHGQAISLKDEAVCSARSMFDRVHVDKREGVAKAVLDVLRHDDGEAVLEILSNFIQHQDQQTGPMRHWNRNAILEGFAEVCQSEVAPSDDFSYREDVADEATCIEMEVDEKADDNDDDDDDEEANTTRLPAGAAKKLVHTAFFSINTHCPGEITLKIATALYERLRDEPFQVQGQDSYKNPAKNQMTPDKALHFTLFIFNAIHHLPQKILGINPSVSVKATAMPAKIEALVAKLRESGGLHAVECFYEEYGRSYGSARPNWTQRGIDTSGRVGLLELHRLYELHRLWDRICYEIGTVDGKPVNEKMHEWAKTGLKRPSGKIEAAARAVMTKDLGIDKYGSTGLNKSWTFPFEASRRWGVGALLLAIGHNNKPFQAVRFNRIGRIMDILWEIDQEYQHPIKDLLELVAHRIVQPVIEHRAFSALDLSDVNCVPLQQLLERVGVAREQTPESAGSDESGRSDASEISGHDS